jgi:hypothetical protein
VSLGIFFEPLVFYLAIALAVIFIIQICTIKQWWGKGRIWLLILLSFSLFATDSLLCCINVRGRSFENTEELRQSITPILQEVADELEYGEEYDCDDYAREFFLKCQSKGIKATVVTSLSLNHAFNAVKLGNQWVLIEPQSFEDGYQNIYSIDNAEDYSLMSYRFANTENSISVRLPYIAIPFWYAGWAIYEYVPNIFNGIFSFIPFGGYLDMQSIATEWNKSCPIEISDNLLLTSCEVIDGRILTYNYKYLNVTAEEVLISEQSIADEKEEYVNYLKLDENISLLQLLKDGKMFRRSYFDSNNKLLYFIEVTNLDL